MKQKSLPGAALTPVGMSKDNKAAVKVNDETEDTTQLLKFDTEPLQPVNVPAWWVYDAVSAFVATFWTHGPGEMSVLERTGAAVYVLTVAFVLQKLYFSSGLDRPMSGQMKIDKWWHMAIVHLGNCVFFWQWSYEMLRQLRSWRDGDQSYLVCALYLFAAFYFVIWCTDVIAGTVHWFGDTTDLYFFQYHHRDSRYMTRQSYVHHTWETFALGFALSYSVMPVLRTTLVGLSIRVIACQANECHMWAHCTSREIPTFIRLLQDLTLVLSWRAHNTHHKAPYLKDYCVFNGWANPVMNRVLPGPLTNGLHWLGKTGLFLRFKEAIDT